MRKVIKKTVLLCVSLTLISTTSIAKSKYDVIDAGAITDVTHIPSHGGVSTSISTFGNYMVLMDRNTFIHTTSTLILVRDLKTGSTYACTKEWLDCIRISHTDIGSAGYIKNNFFKD